MPDLRGRTAIGAGQGTGLTSRTLGATGGEEAHQLVTAELASHTHIQNAHSHTIQSNAAGYASGGLGQRTACESAVSANTTTSVAAVNQNAGSDTPHNTMPPFMVWRYIIKVSATGGATDQAPIADTTQNGLLRKVSGLSTDYVGGDNNCHPLSVPYITKTAAYTLIPADSGKYIICSGGSWTLTLPVPVAGLTYRLRNDMGITGTVGAITLQPTGGTIDGAVSLSLLAQQECTLISDGTNWRTFGRNREVILGTLTVANVPAFSLILPDGYSEFELSFSQLYTSSAMPNMQCQISTNQGSTWLTAANYWGTYLYSSTTSALATSSYSSLTAWYVTHYIENAAARHYLRMKILPGDGIQYPEFMATSTQYQMTVGYSSQFVLGGWYNGGGHANALQFLLSAGNFTKAAVRVKGIV